MLTIEVVSSLKICNAYQTCEKTYVSLDLVIQTEYRPVKTIAKNKECFVWTLDNALSYTIGSLTRMGNFLLSKKNPIGYENRHLPLYPWRSMSSQSMRIVLGFYFDRETPIGCAHPHPNWCLTYQNDMKHQAFKTNRVFLTGGPISTVSQAGA